MSIYSLKSARSTRSRSGPYARSRRGPYAPARPPALPIIAGLERKVTAGRGPAPLSTEKFGITMSEASTQNMHIVQSPVVNAFIVSGEMLHTITWDVWEGVGPNGQVDITSVHDPAISAANYRDVARALRPGQGNKPPRIGYFASDITKQHEMFHVFRHVRYYREALALGLKWLNGRTARTPADVVKLVQKMRSRIQEYGSMKTNPNLGSEENDAYDAGAPLYQARSDTIFSKGQAGDYP